TRAEGHNATLRKRQHSEERPLVGREDPGPARAAILRAVQVPRFGGDIQSRVARGDDTVQVIAARGFGAGRGRTLSRGASPDGRPRRAPLGWWGWREFA